MGKKFQNHSSITVLAKTKANNPFTIHVQGRFINTSQVLQQENENDQTASEEDDDADNWMTNYTGDLTDLLMVIIRCGSSIDETLPEENLTVTQEKNALEMGCCKVEVLVQFAVMNI